ncbi:MAG: hypothetical protein R3213_08495 [Flavobacteriaceae bacterium]|nr:hypothetical protein [Flavobacteriaceae bacterium]
MDDKKNLENLNNVLDISEAWFLKYGEVNPDGHKELKKLLEKAIAGVKKLDYRVDLDDRRVEVIVYLGFWRMLFHKMQGVADSVVRLLESCLHEYEIHVRVRRFKE